MLLLIEVVHIPVLQLLLRKSKWLDSQEHVKLHVYVLHITKNAPSLLHLVQHLILLKSYPSLFRVGSNNVDIIICIIHVKA